MSTNRKPQKDTGPRNRLIYSVVFALFVYAVAVGVQAILYKLGWLGNWGTWVIAPMMGAALSGRMLLGWLRCRAASKSLVKEKEALISELREATYNVNNPLNAITASLIALKSEYNPGSVEQIEISSRRIQNVITKLASLDLSKLGQEEAATVGGAAIDVEQTSRGLSL